MIEEIFYLDEEHINITAASVGISGRRWTDKNNDVNKLWRRIGRVEDLSFRLNQIKQIQLI